MFDASIQTRGALEYPGSAELAREVTTSRGSDFQAFQREACHLLPFVRNLIRHRRAREVHFGPDLFADPAWDLMLALYLSKLQQVRVKVSSAIEESGVPQTTALRWINTLFERGAIVKSNHPTDARSTLIELSDAWAVMMTKWFVSARDDQAKFLF